MTFDYDDVKPKTRTKLSIKLGVLAGITWGLFFTAYYSAIPKEFFLTKGTSAAFKFASCSASVCFTILVIFIFAWPKIITAFKNGGLKP